MTGATGNIGRMVVDELRGSGVKVRALTIDPVRAALPADVEVYRGFLGKPDTLPAALDGVEKVYLAPKPQTVDTVAELARAAGVRHVVALSSILATEDAQDDYSLSFVAIERAVQAAGLDWTFLCPGAFMENTVDWADSVRAEGVVREPFPMATDTPIAMADIAAVATAALLGDGHAGRKYGLSGPEALTVPEQVAIVGEVLGRDVRYVELTREQARQRWLDQGVGEEFTDFMLSGGNEMRMVPERGFTEATGRRGTTYAEWVAQHADAFR
ncbi:NAD(P)H-binding protein [Saccharomonospora sp. NPDC046836]|uniref:NAD(P)H-binding protein n=1 Tax=Saccharomonospora sp. NPDC046836 TaxID=3156921 RepID=UPI0033EE3783